MVYSNVSSLMPLLRGAIDWSVIWDCCVSLLYLIVRCYTCMPVLKKKRSYYGVALSVRQFVHPFINNLQDIFMMFYKNVY